MIPHWLASLHPWGLSTVQYSNWEQTPTRSQPTFLIFQLCFCGCCLWCCRLAIGDLGTQYFADRGIFCAGRVADEDLQRVAKATGELMACRQTGRQACPLLLEVTDRAECRHVGRHDVHGDALLSSFSCHSRLCGAEVATAAVPATYRGGCVILSCRCTCADDSQQPGQSSAGHMRAL